MLRLNRNANTSAMNEKKTPHDTIPAHRGLCAASCSHSYRQLNSYDYLADVSGNLDACNLVEVQFKNTRKAYFTNDNHLDLVKGDIVAVESSPGHDIGIVSLTGSLVRLQIEKLGYRTPPELRRIYRKARQLDIDKWHESQALEQDTMIRSRQMAKELGLDMKIGDVEYQGDGQKAIFYYIADGRVDFRQLIRVLADAFHVRIEMRQIGARQEAGRIGGFGPCGRELCCSTWMTRFNSVSTAAARFQDISSNPQKLAGQCAKLKCCLNYEVDQYVEAARSLPSREIELETQDATYHFFKADVLAGTVSYSTDRRMAGNLCTIPVARAFEIIRMNKAGEKPLRLEADEDVKSKPSHDLLEGQSLTRFDNQRRKKCRKNRGAQRPPHRNNP